MDQDEKIIEIEVERLRAFPGHPFHVTEDEEMLQLIESIRQYGILTPLIVRPVPAGHYEIISGHRRHYAAVKLSYRRVPVIIRVLDDDEAVVSLVDANMHREHLVPSEKAFACRMKYDAIKRKGGRRKGGQDGYRTSTPKTIEIIGKELGESPKQVQRWLKITELSPDLLKKLDDGSLSFTPAAEIAFLKEDEQEELLHAMDYTQSSPSLSQAIRLRKLSRNGDLTVTDMREILSGVKKGEVQRVVFRNEQLRQFFPKDYTVDRIKMEILQMLEHWKLPEQRRDTKGREQAKARDSTKVGESAMDREETRARESTKTRDGTKELGKPGNIRLKKNVKDKYRYEVFRPENMQEPYKKAKQ